MNFIHSESCRPEPVVNEFPKKCSCISIDRHFWWNVNFLFQSDYRCQSIPRLSRSTGESARLWFRQVTNMKFLNKVRWILTVNRRNSASFRNWIALSMNKYLSLWRCIWESRMLSTSYSFELLTISGGGEIIYGRIKGSGETGSRSGTWKTGCIFTDEGSLKRTADLDITCLI